MILQISEGQTLCFLCFILWTHEVPITPVKYPNFIQIIIIYLYFGNLMRKHTSLRDTDEPEINIRITQKKSSKENLFSQFNEDFPHSDSSIQNSNSNFLSTSTKIQNKPSRVKSKDQKRMKLIDYIYIKNTTKKNQKTSIVVDKSMTANELRKSRMKEGKEKAFKAIVDEMIEELKLVSAQALAMSDIVSENIVYTGNTDDIGKLCNVRRILKDNVLASMEEVRKLIGVDNSKLQRKVSRKLSEQIQDELDSKLRRLQEIGVQRIHQQPEKTSLTHQTYRNHLKVANKFSNKDTDGTQRGDSSNQE